MTVQLAFSPRKTRRRSFPVQVSSLLVGSLRNIRQWVHSSQALVGTGFSSRAGSAECSVCDEGYVRIDSQSSTVEQATLDEYSIEWDCFDCTKNADGFRYVVEDGAKCSSPGVHVSSMFLRAGHWRESNTTLLIRPCPVDEGKDVDGINKDDGPWTREETENGIEYYNEKTEERVKLGCVGGNSSLGHYCNSGHTGPLCECAPPRALARLTT